MNLLSHYIDFMVKYRILVGDNLCEDVRIYIWEIYKREIAKDILVIFFRKITLQCRDCLTTNWKINPSEYHTRAKFNFYLAPACSRSDVFMGGCCVKYICRRDCILKN